MRNAKPCVGPVRSNRPPGAALGLPAQRGRRGRPNFAMTLLSKRVIARIRSPKTWTAPFGWPPGSRPRDTARRGQTIRRDADLTAAVTRSAHPAAGTRLPFQQAAVAEQA